MKQPTHNAMAVPIVTAADCRRGRELLGWSSERLSARLGVSYFTLRRFEEQEQWPNIRPDICRLDAETVRAALEAAGVEFVAENGGGAGVRLRKAR